MPQTDDSFYTKRMTQTMYRGGSTERLKNTDLPLDVPQLNLSKGAMKRLQEKINYHARLFIDELLTEEMAKRFPIAKLIAYLTKLVGVRYDANAG